MSSNAGDLSHWLANGTPESTRRTYRAAFWQWVRWCNGSTHCPLPAAAFSLAAYVKELSDGGRSVASVNVALASIRHAHLSAGHLDPTHHPIVDLARQAARHARAGDRAVGREDCPPERLRAWVRASRNQPNAARAARDSALLLVGWWGALRRAEIVGLLLDDVQPSTEPAGIVLHVLGKGSRLRMVGLPMCADVELCPVVAWNAWRGHVIHRVNGSLDTSTECVPAFANVGQRGDVVLRGVTGETVRNVLRRCVALAGDGGNVGPHSLRVGVATALFRNGASMPAVMDHCGWSSVQTAARYYRGGTILGPDNPTHGLLRAPAPSLSSAVDVDDDATR